MRNLKLDESCTSNSKSEIEDWTARSAAVSVQFQISNFEFEVQDSSNFKSLSVRLHQYIECLLQGEYARFATSASLLTVHKSRPHNYILLFVGSFAKEVL